MTDQMTDARTNVGAAAQARRLYLHVKAGGMVIASDLSRLVQTIENLEASNARLRTLSEQQRVYVDFPGSIGTCGPFAINDGRVSIPDVTVTDLVHRLSEQQGEADRGQD